MSLGTRIRRLPGWARWLAVLSLVRLAMAALIPVVTDEAYHWNFAVHPDWSYYDHPAMIAWAIAGGRVLFGDTPLGVRFVPLLFSIGTAALLAVIAGRAYGERAARWTVLVGFAIPGVFWVAASATPDSPLLFFWTLAMACAWKAIESGRLRWWLVTGLAAGGALLSKYSAILLVPSVLGYLLCSKEHRRRLATPGPYLAVAVAFLAFLPALYWNSKHEWASLRFQIVRRLDKNPHVSPLKCLAFLGEQCAAYLPLLAPLAVVWLVQAIRRPARTEERYLLWCAGLTISFFLVLSFGRGIGANWPVPAYLALSVGMASAAARAQGPVARFYSARPRLLLVIMTVAYAVTLSVGAATARRVQPDLFAWKDVCREARRLRAGMPERTFYLGLGRNFVTASQLAFHLGEPDRVYAKNLLGDEGLQYDYWADPPALEGWDAVIVMEEKDYERGRWDAVVPRFREVEPPREFRVPVPLPGVSDLRFYLSRARYYLPP